MASPHGDTRPPTQTFGNAGVPPRARTWPVIVGSVLWALVPLVTLGVFACVPVFHAAAKLRRVWLWLSAAAYTALAVYGITFIPADPTTATVIEDLAGVAILVLMVGGTIHAFVLRGRVFQRPEPMEPAVANALAARRRREESRSMAVSDPALARELRVGRPDLPREYDDGGLIDVNHVPPGVLVTQLGFSNAQAAQAAQRRTSIGGFTSIQELGMYCDLPPSFVNSLSDRVVFLP